MGSRRQGREAALQMLYQIDASEVGAADAVRLYFSHLRAGEAPSGEEQRFASLLVESFETKREAVDERIRTVSHHWRLERMTRVDRNILRLATVELMLGEVPVRVTLNEAVELAKRFGSEGSAGFVNGILDRIASDLRGDESDDVKE